VVQNTQKVADRFGALVGRVRTMFPVRLTDQQNYTRRDADDKCEGYSQTHKGRLTKTGTGSGRSRESSVFGWGSGRGNRSCGAGTKALGSDEAVNDGCVEDENKNERYGCDESERQPRTNVVQKQLVSATQRHFTDLHGKARAERCN